MQIPAAALRVATQIARVFPAKAPHRADAQLLTQRAERRGQASNRRDRPGSDENASRVAVFSPIARQLDELLG